MITCSHWLKKLKIGFQCGTLALLAHGLQISPSHLHAVGPDGGSPITAAGMPDFSHCGYRDGVASLDIKPANTVNLNTAAFRANPTVELQRAIRSNTLVLLPAGTFSLNNLIYISGMNKVVLRGAAGGTTLKFTKSLTDIFGNARSGKWGSHGKWHGEGGMITIGKKGQWYPGNTPARAGSSEIGIENLAIDFARTSRGPYEAGWSGIFLCYSNNCYVKNVSISNFDNGIIAQYSNYNTFSGLTLNPKGGHLGVAMVVSDRNLTTNVNMLSTIAHDLSVYASDWNVFKNSDCSKDKDYDGISHRGQSPSNNLFCNLKLSRTAFGTSNGNKPDSFGKNETYWNVSNARGPHAPCLVYWNQPIIDLHQAQLNRRK